MNDITSLIKDLRNKTGAGFLDCKNALSENNNDLEKAIEYLRKKGLAKASKKSSREANEGAIGIYSNNSIIVVIKVNSETDFAAKSNTFLDFLDNLGNIALANNKLELNKDEFINLSYNDGSVGDYVKSMIAQIGENLVIKDMIILNNSDSHYSYYIHNSYKNNIGKIISLLKYTSSKKNDEITTLTKNLCMHIAAMKPESLDIEDLDKELIQKEENIQKELILSSGKPENIVDKILKGKMNKFFSEVTLYNQQYILDQDKNIKSVIKEYQENYEFKIKSFRLISL